MADNVISCPECNGAGFFGGNGPIVDSKCGLCKGEGSIVEGSYRSLEQVVKRPPITETQWREVYKTLFAYRHGGVG